MAKNRQRTEEKILEAVTRVVDEEGIEKLGVNAVSEKAGVAKMLIYRYYGSFQGLLEKWALRHSYWIEETRDLESSFKGIDRLSGKKRLTEITALLKSMLMGQIRSLRKERVKREILRWLLSDKNEVAAKVMEGVEARGVEISRLLRARIDPKEDVEALVAVVIGGLNYLALIADRTNRFNGVPLHSEEGWKRIETAVGRMIDRTLIGEKR